MPHRLYLALCDREADRSGFSARKIGSEADLHHTSVANYLKIRHLPRVDDMRSILQALRIDPVRACIAIEVFGNIEAYDTPATKLLSRLIQDVAQTLVSDECELEEDLHQWETRSLSGKISQLIVDLIGPRARLSRGVIGRSALL